MVTNGAFSCPTVRKRTVLGTNCSFASYDSRDVIRPGSSPGRERGRVYVGSCGCMSLVLKGRYRAGVKHNKVHPLRFGAFDGRVRGTVAGCYRTKNGFFMSNTCITSSL